MNPLFARKPTISPPGIPHHPVRQVARPHVLHVRLQDLMMLRFLPSAVEKEPEPQHDALQLHPRHDMRHVCSDCDADTVQDLRDMVIQDRMWTMLAPVRGDVK